MIRASLGLSFAASVLWASAAQADTVTLHGQAVTYSDFGLEPELLDSIGFSAAIGSTIEFTITYDSTQYEGVGSFVLSSPTDSIELDAPFRVLAGAQDDVTTSFGDLVDWFGAGAYATYVDGGYGPIEPQPGNYVRFQLGLIMADYDHSILPGADALTYLNDQASWEVRDFYVSVEDTSRATDWYFNALYAHVTSLSATVQAPPPPPPPQDTDGDDDGVADASDQCAGTAPGVATNADGCSIDQLVPCSGPGATWSNQGAYMSALAQVAQQFLDAGLITEAEKDAIISGGAKNHCGKGK